MPKTPAPKHKKPRRPAGLAPRGRSFWDRTVEDNEPSDTELELLAEVCRSLDLADALRAVVADQGVTALGSTGQIVVHPAVTELRQLRLSIGRLVAQLAIPDDEDETVDSPATVRARGAAKARWERKAAVDKRRRANRAAPA